LPIRAVSEAGSSWYVFFFKGCLSTLCAYILWE